MPRTETVFDIGELPRGLHDSLQEVCSELAPGNGNYLGWCVGAPIDEWGGQGGGYIDNDAVKAIDADLLDAGMDVGQYVLIHNWW